MANLNARNDKLNHIYTIQYLFDIVENQVIKTKKSLLTETRFIELI